MKLSRVTDSRCKTTGATQCYGAQIWRVTISVEKIKKHQI